MTKILLVEDNNEIRENTTEILELAGYHVTTAVNGKEGYEMAQKETPDLIVCDIMMPVLDGYGLLHLINKNEGLKTIPFIFLTAKTERSDFRKGMEMGADDYLTKPFTDIELLNAVESRLKKIKFQNERAKASQHLDDFFNEVKNEDALEKLAAARGANRLVAEVSDSAQDFFRRRGFVPQQRNTVTLGGEWLAVRNGKILRSPLSNSSGYVSDALQLPGGRLLVVTRAVSATGLEKGLAEAVQTRNGGLELKKLASLSLGPTANVEGITAEPRPGGGTRLWLVTDNDFRPRAPTLLVALDLP